MKLIDALGILRRPVADDAPPATISLTCGFTPLHLQTFLTAQLRTRFPHQRVKVEAGLFGDLVGNIERLEPSGVHTLVAVVEWGDLDARLGIRTLGGWRPSNQSDIAWSVEQAAARLERVLVNISRHVPVVACMPTLPLPPMFWTLPGCAGPFEMRLHQTIASLAASLSEHPGVSVANMQLLGEISPPDQRFDVKSDVTTGFPYSLAHASTLAGLLAGLVDRRPPKKGLITDLDDTLWGGILGEEGADGISWHLESRTHLHGLYQQFLASLAGAGVLVGVASKNDASLVEQAFGRSDLLISRNDVFPFEVHWSRKSESVQRILDAWNIGADSVVFIDDSPMEAAEVKTAFPGMECLVFPKGDYQGIWNLFKDLRGFFGKPVLTEDDSLRLDSIRNAGAWRDSIRSAGHSPDDFLRAADASVSFSLTRDAGDARAFELVNKTSQFNLNGRRFGESAWRELFNDPTAFLLGVSYKDKYGPLGTVAVVLGTIHERQLHVPAWVMSCRAFSRRIEHQCLHHLFEIFEIDAIVFDYEATPRNGPLQEFFTQLLGKPPVPGLRISREQFSGCVPALFHRIEETTHV